jgi:hypothetical protein
MIEQGVVMLIQSDAAVKAIAAQGGFLATLPSDYQLPSWTYLLVSDVTDYVLTGPSKLSSRRVQFDCYGTQPADIILLGNAIDKLLNGYRGTLPDPDATVVQGIFHLNSLDFFDVDSRTYRRSLDYMIWFEQQ